MKEFVELEHYVRSIPQNKLVDRDTIVKKIIEKRDEYLAREQLGNSFFRRDELILWEGDLVVFDINYIAHPAIVIRVNPTSVDAVVLSTKDKAHSIMQIVGSRMFPNSYITCTIVNIENDVAKKRWFGIFDVPSEMKRLKRELKNHYSKLFKDAGKQKQEEKTSSIVNFI